MVSLLWSEDLDALSIVCFVSTEDEELTVAEELMGRWKLVVGRLTDAFGTGSGEIEPTGRSPIG